MFASDTWEYIWEYQTDKHKFDQSLRNDVFHILRQVPRS